MKDHEIVELYWLRDENAISESEKKYGSYCKTIAQNILHNNEDADECVNDTWVGAWNSMPPHKPSRLSVFLGKITRNISINKYKQNHTEKRGFGEAALVFSELENCIPDNSSPDSVIDEKLIVDIINKFLYSVDTKKRNIFIKRYWYLFSIKDIAKSYGMNESSVASILMRMRNDLRVMLQKEGISI